VSFNNQQLEFCLIHSFGESLSMPLRVCCTLCITVIAPCIVVVPHIYAAWVELNSSVIFFEVCCCYKELGGTKGLPPPPLAHGPKGTGPFSAQTNRQPTTVLSYLALMPACPFPFAPLVVSKRVLVGIGWEE